NELTLRASYGEIGNVPYADGWGTIYNQYTLVGPVSYGGDSGLGLSAIGNPSLIWETAKQFNVGLDFNLANNIFGASIDFYDKKTADAIYNAAIPLTTGGGATQKNIGEILNRGVEVSFNLRPIN